MKGLEDHSGEACPYRHMPMRALECRNAVTDRGYRVTADVMTDGAVGQAHTQAAHVPAAPVLGGGRGGALGGACAQRVRTGFTGGGGGGRYPPDPRRPRCSP